MDTNDFAPLKLFITGPTMLREQVRQAGLLPEFGHRDTENDKRSAPIFRNLRLLAGAGEEFEPIIVNGSGTTIMETAVRSLVADGETVLNVSVGAFGDLFHTIAKANGKKAVQLRFDYGQAIDPAALEKALIEHRPGVVTFTHNETSTGVMNDMKAVCDLVRRHGALPVVDGVSIFGGADLALKEARPAMYCTSTQKSLALPAGFGIGFINAEALAKAEKVENRGHTTDILKIVDKARKNQTLTTPNTTLINQMAVQLDYIVNEEGMGNRFRRHIEMRGMVQSWVESLEGFDLLAPEGHRSPTLTGVLAPEGVTVSKLKELKERMRARGYLFDPGYGKLNAQLEEAGRRVMFRVGHMGDIQPAMLEAYLSELGEELRAL